MYIYIYIYVFPSTAFRSQLGTFVFRYALFLHGNRIII
jgi:hypothetical protein